MDIVITGQVSIKTADTAGILSGLGPRIKPVRFVHDLERIVVAAAGGALDCAGIDFPVAHSGIGLYIGVDDAVEDVKDEYFRGIMRDGIWGASPLLFPFTSPNALAAQISIVFDIRGESSTMHIKDSCRDVIEYAVECIAYGYTSMAVAGGIFRSGGNGYAAQFIFLEEARSAMKRGAPMQRPLKDFINDI